MRKLLLITPLALLTACGYLWEFRSLHEFKQFTWNKSDVRTFEGEVSKSGNYDVYVLFRHVQGFPYQDMSLHMKFETSDTNLSQEVIIPVVGDDGEYLGEGSVDIWDIEHLVYPAIPLQAGKCTFTIAHTMDREDLQLVMEVGVMVKHVNEELRE